MTIDRTNSPKPKLPNEKLVFGHSFTDHMLEVDWDKTTGWTVPRITPYHNLSLDPSCSVFHYAIEVRFKRCFCLSRAFRELEVSERVSSAPFQCFEGMKAYKDRNGSIRLFRPMENMKRMNTSCGRLSLPVRCFSLVITFL